MIIYIYISIRQADLSVVMDNGVEWCSILVSFKENCNVNKKYRFNYFLNQKKHCCQCFSLSFFALRHICYSPNNFLKKKKKKEQEKLFFQLTSSLVWWLCSERTRPGTIVRGGQDFEKVKGMCLKVRCRIAWWKIKHHAGREMCRKKRQICICSLKYTWNKEKHPLHSSRQFWHS